MNIDQPENKIINFLRINKKIFAYTTIIILIILAAFIFFLNNSDKEKTKISEKYYYAKVLLNNGQTFPSPIGKPFSLVTGSIQKGVPVIKASSAS